MAYIGREPQVGNFQVCDAISVVNGQAAYTMQVSSVNVSPETAFHVLCSLNGVLQKPGSSFTVSGSTITFASNLVTGDVIDFIQILGSTLDLGVPSNDTVGAAQIKDDLISGSTELATAPADTDEFLVSDAGTLKRIDYSLIKGGGALELLATTTISNNANISFDSSLITDTYKTYKVVVENLHSANDDVYIYWQISSNNGTGYETSGYSRMIYYIDAPGSVVGNAYGNENKSGFYLNGSGGLGNSGRESLDAEITFFGFREATSEKISSHKTIFSKTNAATQLDMGAFSYRSDMIVNNIKLLTSSGNLSSGTVKFYGVK